MKPNEDEEAIHEEFDFSTIPLPRLEGHAWRQMGPQLICQSCPQPHAVFLKPGLQYAGNNEEGKPIVRKIW